MADVSEDQLHEALNKVGFPLEMQSKHVNELSGGWRMKLLLASAMMRDCDILLLDEPTNHLDRESVIWLSHYLTGRTCDAHGLGVACYSGERRAMRKLLRCRCPLCLSASQHRWASAACGAEWLSIVAVNFAAMHALLIPTLGGNADVTHGVERQT